MSHHARIEEVDDEPDDMDISTLTDLQKSHPRTNPDLMDLTDLNSFSTAARGNRIPPPASSSTPSLFPNTPADMSAFNPALMNPGGGGGTQTAYVSASDAAAYKAYQCVYPVYFDATRSRQGGRKVSKEFAVTNPLAREIVDACNDLGLKTVFEPGKTHPKDWANPGRVRVLLKVDGEAVDADVKNKFTLFNAIGSYLRAHPAAPDTPLKLRIPNVPWDGKVPEPPVVPRGWKMGTILPLHSPALSGGGVTDDIFKEMMQGMGMGMMGDAGGSSGAGAPTAGQGQIEGKREKREKKKKR